MSRSTKKPNPIVGLVLTALIILVVFTLAVALIEYCFGCGVAGAFVQCYSFCRAPL